MNEIKHITNIYLYKNIDLRMLLGISYRLGIETKK